MKIGITGHTKGIGKGLFEYYTRQGHNCQGYSRSNGFDLKNSISRIAKQCADCNVFINNAHYGFQQVLLLHRMSKLWWHCPDRLLICIGSIDADKHFSTINSYAVQKIALDRAVHQLQQSDAQFKLVLFKIGLVDTELTKSRTGAKLSIEKVVSAIDHIVSHRDEMLISYMTLLPVPQPSDLPIIRS